MAESAQALAAHWEQEASRQAARAQTATTLHQQVLEISNMIKLQAGMHMLQRSGSAQLSLPRREALA